MKPLDGLTILDLPRVLACPFASMVLAELGEHHRGERAREYPREVEDRQAVERLHLPPKARIFLLTSRASFSASSSGRSAASWKRRVVCAIAGWLPAQS